ncbi:NAD(P)-binding domain-containing protein [Agromyces silvae]|uniref:NAD(P)-binding domain-containing protein n=1 Tax=Agromyces silvae TaxID=3388266 RepID=UPI00280C2AE4|nr:NAD(P)-binding domain-containing protein [Agromyces protaetiae]
MTHDFTRIGIVGHGAMGAALAAAQLHAGTSTTVWNSRLADLMVSVAQEAVDDGHGDDGFSRDVEVLQRARPLADAA